AWCSSVDNRSESSAVSRSSAGGGGTRQATLARPCLPNGKRGPQHREKLPKARHLGAEERSTRRGFKIREQFQPENFQGFDFFKAQVCGVLGDFEQGRNIHAPEKCAPAVVASARCALPCRLRDTPKGKQRHDARQRSEYPRCARRRWIPTLRKATLAR